MRKTLARRLQSSGGATNAEYLVIAGVIVVAIITILGMFGDRLGQAGNSISRCITGAVRGNFGACGGGSTSAPTVAGGAGPINAGTGLPMAAMNDPRSSGSQSPIQNSVQGNIGSDVMGNLAGALPQPGMKPGAASGGPGGPGRFTKDQTGDAIKNFLRNATAGETGEVESVAYQAFVKSFSAGGEAQYDAMRQMEAQSDLAHSKAMQNAREAVRLYRNGDYQGAMAALQQGRRNEIQANIATSRAEGTKGEMATQATEEYLQASGTAVQVLGAAAAPVMFVVTTPVSMAAAPIANWALPNHPLAAKVITAGVTLTVGLVAGAALPQTMTGFTAVATQQMTPAAMVATNLGVNASQTGTQYIITRETHGEQAATEDAWISMISGVIPMIPGLPPSTPGGPRRTIGQYLHETDTLSGARFTIENRTAAGQVNVTIENLAKLRRDGFPPQPDTPHQAVDSYIRSARTPHEGDPLPPPDPAFVKKFAATTLTPEETRMAHDFAKRANWSPAKAVEEWRYAKATGRTTAYRDVESPEAMEGVRTGEFYGKDKHMVAKSSTPLGGKIPLDQSKSKLGAGLRDAETGLAEAIGSRDANRVTQAQSRVDAANRAIRDSNFKAWRALAEGHYTYSRDPKSGQWVFTKNVNGKTRFVVTDLDEFTHSENAAGRGDRIHHSDYGEGHARDLQDLANRRAAAGDNGTGASAHQHFSDAGNPNPGAPEKRIAVFSPAGPELVTGSDIPGAVASRNMRTNPRWGKPPSAPAPAEPNTQHGNAAVARDRLNGQRQFLNDTGRNSFQINQALGESNRRQPPRRTEVWPGFHITLARFSMSGSAGSEETTTNPQAVAAQQLMDLANATMAGAKPEQLWVEARLDRIDPLLLKLGRTAPDSPSYTATLDSIRPDVTESALASQVAAQMIAQTFQLPGLYDPGDATSLTAEFASTAPMHSAVHARLHEYASPAWRGDFGRLLNLNESVIEYLTREALATGVQQGLPRTHLYPALPVQVVTGQYLATVVGEGPLRAAYFSGDLSRLGAIVGASLGETDAARAEIVGRDALRTMANCLDAGFTSDVQQVLRLMQQRSPAEAKAALDQVSEKFDGLIASAAAIAEESLRMGRAR